MRACDYVNVLISTCEQSLSAVLQELVRLTSHDKNGSLLRIVPYQHLVWACEIGTGKYF